jgi:hypothetical protein
MTVVTTPKGDLIRNGSAARGSSGVEPVEVAATPTASLARSSPATNEP